MRRRAALGAAVLAAACAACGGGGNTVQLTGGQPYAIVSSSPTASPSAGPTGPTAVTGTVVSIPAGTYGSGAPQTPLAGATVVVGPVLVTGATPPATIPAGDATAVTGAAGTYSVTVPGSPVAPVAAQAAFVPSLDDLSGVTIPASGFYVAVFAPGANGTGAGAPLPVHAFSAVGAGGTLATQRVTVATADEANFLTLLNRDRTAANPLALPLIFDETAEEAARLHVAEEAAGAYYCHYNLHNVGPGSRYLSLFGLGEDEENIGLTSGLDAPAAYAAVEAQFIAEASAGGPHYTNIIDSTRAWAGLAVLVADPTDQYVDQELDSPHQTNPYIYPNFTGSHCPAGVYVNNS